MKAADKLRAYWSKGERDLMLWNPAGEGTRPDARFLSDLFGKDFQAEMERRGYDFTTLKFEISPKVGNQRFASQRVKP